MTGTELKFKGFYASICSDNKSLPVYQVTEVDERTVKCYIPSEAGKKYGFHMRAADPESIPTDGFFVRLYTDGLLRAGTGYAKTKSIWRHDLAISNSSRRPLMFSTVRTTDVDGDHNTTFIKPEDLGLIELRVWYSNRKPRPSTSKRMYGITHMGQDGSAPLVHESSKKAGFHVSTLGEVFQTTIKPSSAHHIRTTSVDNPHCVFRFYHQPLEMLQAAGIAPKPETAPEPVHLPATSSKKRPASQTTNAEAGPSKRRKTSVQIEPPTSVNITDERPLAPTQVAHGSDDDEIVVVSEQPKSAAPKRSSKGRRLQAESEHSNNASAEAGSSSRIKAPSSHKLAQKVKPSPPLPPWAKRAVPPSQSPPVADRASQLKAQIAAREIRIRRLAEEEQLAVEKAELAALEAQVQKDDRKGKGKERA
ncbi:unnamed protein product [Peniophora sp. CBMAI 1063]|nr:unnamed protein product [Peniophora sp. CBMAI 1063]